MSRVDTPGGLGYGAQRLAQGGNGLNDFGASVDAPYQAGQADDHVARFIRLLWSRRRLVLWTSLVCLVAAGGLAVLAPRRHQAEVRIEVGMAPHAKPLRSATALAARLSSATQVEELLLGPGAHSEAAVGALGLRSLKTAVSQDQRTVTLDVGATSDARALAVVRAVSAKVVAEDQAVLDALAAQRHQEITQLQGLLERMKAALPGGTAARQGNAHTGTAPPWVPMGNDAQGWGRAERFTQTIASLQADGLAPETQPTRLVYGPELIHRRWMRYLALAGALGLLAGLFAALLFVLVSDALERQT